MRPGDYAAALSAPSALKARRTDTWWAVRARVSASQRGAVAAPLRRGAAAVEGEVSHFRTDAM
jgi:hypothetical protein